MFYSDRNGTGGMWLRDADGSGAVEVFPRAGSPCWSPDGKCVAFASGVENLDIYIIRASGGSPIRLTTNSASHDAPSWSRDGKWVYFASDRTGRSEVWKVSSEGGQEIQVTRNRGDTPLESIDGRSIYYTKGVPGEIWKMPVGGAEESPVHPSVIVRAFSLASDGIYFIPVEEADRKSSIQFLNFATSKVKTVAASSRPLMEGLSVSPDGRSILFSQDDEVGIDLMLIDNFR